MTGPSPAPVKPAVFSRSNRPTLDGLDSAPAFLLPIWKPAGKSSSFFVNRFRWHLSRIHRVKRFRVGHGGTLDPFAAGVLVVLGGKATSLQESVIHQPKAYLATVRFGATSPSLDPDTEVIVHDPEFHVDRALLEGAANSMLGVVDQLPPDFSAKRIAGKRAYELARAGKAAVLVPAKVRIDAVRTHEVRDAEADIEVRCGSGCYIRAVARDLAAALGTVGYLRSLERIESAGFTKEDCWPFDVVLGFLQSCAISETPTQAKPRIN